MSTLGSLIIAAIIAIVGAVLWAAVYDQGDDTTPWDAAELEWTNTTAAEVVRAAAWPQPQTSMSARQPLDTPVHFREGPIEWAVDGQPKWWHEHHGTTAYQPRHDGTETKVWSGYTPARKLALTEDTGAWSVAEITGELVGAR